MRYAISYVSTASLSLSAENIKNLLDEVSENNNRLDITGVLLSSDTNFFQLIEGEESLIKDLYSHIVKDLRHNSIIKIVDKAVFLPAYDGFTCAVVTSNTKYNGANLREYLHQIEVLDPTSQKAVKRVIEALLI